MDQDVPIRQPTMPYSIAYGSGRKETIHPVSDRTDGFGNRAVLPLYGCESKETLSVDPAVL